MDWVTFSIGLGGFLAGCAILLVAQALPKGGRNGKLERSCEGCFENSKAIDSLRSKVDTMRMTMTDAVDKVEMFGRRWLKRERDESKNGKELPLETPPPTNSDRLSRVRQRMLRQNAV